MSNMPARIVALIGDSYKTAWVSEDMEGREQIMEFFADQSETYVRADLARTDLVKALTVRSELKRELKKTLTERDELKRALKQLVRMVDGTPVDDNETYNLAQMTLERWET